MGKISVFVATLAFTCFSNDMAMDYQKAWENQKNGSVENRNIEPRGTGTYYNYTFGMKYTAPSGWSWVVAEQTTTSIKLTVSKENRSDFSVFLYKDYVAMPYGSLGYLGYCAIKIGVENAMENDSYSNPSIWWITDSLAGRDDYSYVDIAYNYTAYSTYKTHCYYAEQYGTKSSMCLLWSDASNYVLNVSDYSSALNGVNFNTTPTPISTFTRDIPTLEIKLQNTAIMATQKLEKMELFNLQGRKIKESNNTNLMNVEDIPSGVYMIMYKMNGKKGISKIQKE